MTESSEWRDECYLIPSGERFCVKVDDTHAHTTREWMRTLMVDVLGFTPTAAPKVDNWSKFSAELKSPVFLTPHEHQWRMSSAVHEGQAIYQCVVCEATAIEGDGK